MKSRAPAVKALLVWLVVSAVLAGCNLPTGEAPAENGMEQTQISLGIQATMLAEQQATLDAEVSQAAVPPPVQEQPTQPVLPVEQPTYTPYPTYTVEAPPLPADTAAAPAAPVVQDVGAQVKAANILVFEDMQGMAEVTFNYYGLTSKDALIIISNSGRNAAPIEMAREAQKHGHKVIAETCTEFSLSQPSRHSSGKRLLDYADVILDNKGVFGDTVVKMEGLELGLGPASGVVGAYIIHAMLVEIAFKMREKGVEKPPVFMHGNLDGGMETNEALFDKYWYRIRNW